MDIYQYNSPIQILPSVIMCTIKFYLFTIYLLEGYYFYC